MALALLALTTLLVWERLHTISVLESAPELTVLEKHKDLISYVTIYLFQHPKSYKNINKNLQ